MRGRGCWVKLIFCIFGFLFYFGCASQQVVEKDACSQEPLSPKNLVICHDQAFAKLNTDTISATATLDRLCRKNLLARACSNLGFYYEDVKHASGVNLKLSFDYYDKACGLSDGVACNNLANLYISGRGTNLDAPKGVRLLLMACDLNYAPSCYRSAIITMRGILLKNDPQAAAQFMIKGCELGDAISCHDLGYLYMDGKGVPRNQAKALEVIKYACDNGLPRGCGTLGSFYLMGGAEGIDYAKAYDLIGRACAGDDAPSCANYGFMIETGKGVEADPKRAAQYYIKACNAGDLLGCGNLGVLMAEGRGVEQNDLSALPYLERACSDQISEACRYRAIFQEEGRAGIPKSKVGAKFYRKKACEYGDEISCASLVEGFESLCLKDETQAMACMTGAKRMFSLCSLGQGTKTAKLIYRFGRKGKIELEYTGQFKFTEDAWATGEKFSLSFVNQTTNGEVSYKLIEEISKKSVPSSRQIEIKIKQKSAESTIACRVPVIGTINSDVIRKAANLGN